MAMLFTILSKLDAAFHLDDSFIIRMEKRKKAELLFLKFKQLQHYVK